MERLRSLVDSIGLDELFNCILVRAGVRPAFLIQPADYNEASSSDPVTAGKVSAIRAEFPELVLSNIRGETLVSKQAYSPRNIRSNADMGTIIGYPCAAEYEHVLVVSESQRTIGIDIIAHLAAGGNSDSVQLLAYVCLDDRHFAGAQAFAAAAERVLKSDPIVGAVVLDVTASIDVRVPVTVLIEKLVAGGDGLSGDEKWEIQNKIWNLGFESVSELNPDYSNPVHRGMVIALLLLYKNNPVSPFYPLQLRAEVAAVDKETELLGTGLIKAFADTAGRRGGKRRTRRRAQEK
jgi:hypothetical protein